MQHPTAIKWFMQACETQDEDALQDVWAVTLPQAQLVYDYLRYVNATYNIETFTYAVPARSRLR